MLASLPLGAKYVLPVTRKVRVLHGIVAVGIFRCRQVVQQGGGEFRGAATNGRISRSRGEANQVISENGRLQPSKPVQLRPEYAFSVERHCDYGRNRNQLD